MKENRILAAAARQERQVRGISITGLKLIALVSMVMDHIYYIFGCTGRIPWWFGLAGRLAAPLFLFCLVEGFTHTRNRKRYFGRVLCVAAPMGLLLFFMRFAGLFVRPDGFYPQNAMLSSFLLLIICFQSFDWIGSKKPGKILAGCAVLLGLFLWPFFFIGTLEYGGACQRKCGRYHRLYAFAYTKYFRRCDAAGPFVGHRFVCGPETP